MQCNTQDNYTNYTNINYQNLDTLIDRNAWMETIQRISESTGERKRDPVPSSRPGPCIFKGQVRDLVLCFAPPSESEQWFCSLDKPAEPHMLCDPWRAAAYQAPAGLGRKQRVT